MLHFLARHGRVVLVLGLIAAVLLPEVAQVLKGWLPELIASLLFMAALRIGARDAIGRLADLRSSLALVAVYQIAVPLVLFAVFRMLGWSGPLVTAALLVGAACSISSSPNLTLMTGNDPAPALRLLVVGTALLPLTIIPVFWFLPELGSASAVLSASGWLFVLIVGAAGFAFALRRVFFPQPSADTLRAIDGLSALAMAVVVVGLMAAVTPALKSDPKLVFWTLVAAFAVNFGLQIAAYLLLGQAKEARVAYSIISGNRNMALFISALPVSVVEPLLLFIGCYQVPMYLTPLLLGRLYRK